MGHGTWAGHFREGRIPGLQMRNGEAKQQGLGDGGIGRPGDSPCFLADINNVLMVFLCPRESTGHGYQGQGHGYQGQV